MRKRLTAILLLSVGMAMARGPAVAGEVAIVGTGSGVAVLEAIAAAFTREHPDIVIKVPKSIGSRGAIRTVGGGEHRIGRVARPIWDKEKHFGLVRVPYAKVPVVFFTNQSVGIKGLSARQICDIYSGQLRNWEAVGGKNAKIRVVRREEGDSSLSVLRDSLPGFGDIAITQKSKTTLSDPLTIEFVQEKADTVGFGTYGNARRYRVVILSIDGKGPTDPDYPHYSPLGFVFKEKDRSGDIAKFLDFATSEAAHEAIRSAGGLPF